MYRRPLQLIALLFVLAALLATTGCTRKEPVSGSGKLLVVTTLFPLYDFARTIAGERADVRMLLPPGTEPHHFEPRPDDILTIRKARLFIYTNRFMEPWAERLISGAVGSATVVVDAGKGVRFLPLAADEGEHDHHDDHSGSDPHIWLDLDNAALMVDTILAGFIAVDPPGADHYRRNATALKATLAALDQHYRSGLANCRTRTLLHGGHFTFGYLARRYGLDYHALSGASAQAEPSAADMAAMVRRIRASGVRHIFAEELLSPRLTETLAAETGITVLKLNGAHTLSQAEFNSGKTFPAIMEQNLVNLRKGLECR